MKPHKELLVWQQGFAMVKELYLITNSFPPEEKFSTVSQIRRASMSIPCNIAEGAARSTKKEFRYFLYIASGSVSELDTLILLSYELEFINEKQKDDLLLKLNSITKLLKGLIKKVSEQCEQK